MATFPENPHNYTSLFDAPLKDYTIIAKDGQEIHVHKMMLWMRCRMFKSLFNRTEMRQEDFIQTTYNYDVLLSVVKWMYGSEINLTNDVYAIADHFDIPELLYWKLYITINDEYIHKFIDFENGKITPDLVEERNYTEIYNSVISAIAKTCYTYDGYTTCETIYTHIRTKRGLSNAKDRILHKAPIRMLKSWIMSRDRINDEDDVLYALKTYMACNPDLKDIVESELMPLVNTDLTNIQHGRFISFSDIVNGIANLTHPVTYFQLLTQFYTDYKQTCRDEKLAFMILPNNYDADTIVDILRLTEDDEDYYYETKLIPLKSLILRYRSNNNEVCEILFGDVIRNSKEYNEFLDMKRLFSWRNTVDVCKYIDDIDE